MAIALDAVSTATGAAVSSLTWSHTTAGSDRLLLVAVVTNGNAGGGTDVTGVTYAGVSLTLVGEIAAGSSSQSPRVELWRLVAPATGANSVVVTLAASAASVAAAAASYTGVDQTTPIRTSGTNSGSSTSPSITLAQSASGDVAVAALAGRRSETATSGGGQTNRWNVAEGSGGGSPSDARSVGDEKAGAANVSISWTLSASVEWAVVGCSIQPSLPLLQAQLSGTASVTASPSLTARPTAQLSGAASVSASAVMTLGATAALAGTAAIAASPRVVLSGQAAYVVEVDWNNDGDYNDANEDITADVLALECWRGRDPPDWLLQPMQPGKCTIALDNRSGKYSPFNSSSPLYNLIRAGLRVRVRTTAPVAVTIWTGRLLSVRPDAAAVGVPLRATLEAEGPLGWISRQVAEVLADTAGSLVSAQIAKVLDAVSWPSGDRSLRTAIVTTGPWPVATDQPTVPGGYARIASALELLQDLAMTEIGDVYETADGKIAFDDREAHDFVARQYTIQAHYSDAANATHSYASLEFDDGQDRRYSQVACKAAPVTTGSLQVLWTYPSSGLPVIPAGGSAVFTAIYPTVNDIDGLYVDSWTTPVVGTDVTATGGTLAISNRITKTATTMRFVVRNTHSTDSATLTLVQARGVPVTRGDVTEVVATNDSTVSSIGKRKLEWPASYYKSVDDARKAAQLLLYHAIRARDTVTLTVPANQNSTVMSSLLQRELRDLVEVTANNKIKLGLVGRDYHVHLIRHRIDDAGARHTVTLGLVNRRVTPVNASADDDEG